MLWPYGHGRHLSRRIWRACECMLLWMLDQCRVVGGGWTGADSTVVVRLLSLASAVLLVVVGLGPTVVACRWPERLDYSVVSLFYGFVSVFCWLPR